MKTDRYTSRSAENEIRGNVHSKSVEKVAKNSHETGTQLYKLEASIDYEVPWKCFAEACDPDP